MKNLDLFGGETEARSDRNMSDYQRWKAVNNYRKSKNPEEKCGLCDHYFRRTYAKKYHKCKLLGGSFSSATDVRVRCVCNQFKRREDVN